MNLNGMWKIGSRQAWWFNKNKCVYFISLPEWILDRAVWNGIYILKALGFYATKCSCSDKQDWPLKFRLFRCGDCRYRDCSHKTAEANNA
jgi:hypothetical protein